MPESQNGRIGGGVLKDNLLRQGKDLAFDTDLLYLKVDQTVDAPTVPGLDVDDGDPNYQLGAGNTGAIAKGIGINTQAIDDDLSIPSVTNPFRSTNLKSTDYTNISNFTIQNSNITAFGNDLFLSSTGNIFATSIATDDLKIDFNTISTTTPNTNIELRPNGNGTVNINSNLNITGSLHATGNIETVGDFTFGSDDEDDVVFAANVNSDIMPDQNNTSSLGDEYKRWMDIYTSLVNGEAIILDELIVGDGASSLGRRQGNTFYVSTLGSDTNVGDHQHGAFRTLKHALSVIDGSTAGPTAIHIYPGEYEEEFPLTVPSHVDIVGEDLRNTIIKPTNATNTNTAFYIEDDVTIENLTIKDFYSPGYAFEFTSNGLVNTRSPYIKNVSVITQGSIAGVQHILENPDAVPTGSNDRFGSAVAIDGDYVVAAATGEQTGYVYIYNKNTGELLHSIAAPSANNDLFGYSVDVSGNYAIVGDYIDDSLGTNTGIAYIIDVTTGSVVHTLTEPSPSSNNYFGYDVAIDGNYAVVGARGNGGDIGKAYIFNVTTGNVLHTLDNPTGFSDRRFAYNVAISGTNVLVGAQYESSGGYAAAGKVYMFSATTGSLTRTFSNPESGSSKQADYFGAGIAIDGSNIVIGANNSNLAADTGKLYFYNTSGTLIDSFVPEQDNQDAIGDVVSISGDNVVLGFYEADNRQGKVQIYSHSTSELLYEGLNPGNTSNQDYFANAVDIDGTILVVGSRSYDDGSINAAGRTFIIDIADTTTFEIGDAGKGALIDGSVLDSASLEASMLFHSCTFITPGVDAITMTNGVRVEWLNSFTYFANRGLYATQGATGKLMPDASIRYGAEVRSIGSANVYGNYGVVADGANTLLYLISHNFGYIGVGSDSSNDNTLSIQSQEIVELNSGTIVYTSTDQKGNFRVGDNFFVDFDTGETSIDANSIDFSGIGSIIVNNGVNSTYIDGERVDTGNIRITGNTVTTVDGDLNLSPQTELFNTDNNAALIVSRGTDIQRNNETADFRYNTETDLFEGFSSGNLSFGGVYSSDRNESIDAHDTNNTIVLRAGGIQVGSIDSDSTNLHGLSTGDVLFDNTLVTTTLSNSNLELKRATPTNVVNVYDFDLKENTFLNTSNNILSLATTANGFVKFAGTTGLVIPSGLEIEQPVSPEIGESRYNVDQEWLETWNGDSWQRSAGEGEEVTDEVLKEFVDIYTLVLG